MNTELFIAKKIVLSKENKSLFLGSKAIIRIASIAISLGLIVMILSVAIVTGFKSQIRNKVIGFGSHITITNMDNNTSYETIPINKNQSFYPSLEKEVGIKHIQVYAIKAGIIKTNTEIQGVVLKGVGKDYDWSFFEKNIVEGKHFSVSDTAKNNQVIISKQISTLLKLKTGDNLFMYFIQNPPRLRKFKICGIYETSFEDLDKLIIIADIAQIQKLNDWTDEQISGFEVLINDYEQIDNITSLVQDKAGFKFNADGSKLRVSNIKQNNPQIFDWLALTDTNVIIILVLMLIVAGFNMITGLLVIILERTNMIGILKALGTSNWSIRKIFLYQATFIIGKGLIWGNIIGIGLCIIQYYTHLVKLDPASYYVTSVPINLNFLHLLFLNIGTLIVTIFMLILPSYIITRISPVKAIKFN